MLARLLPGPLGCDRNKRFPVETKQPQVTPGPYPALSILEDTLHGSAIKALFLREVLKELAIVPVQTIMFYRKPDIS